MAPENHHHRSTTKQNKKTFKSRHATKNSLKELSKGKVESFERGSRKTPHQQVMSKFDRRNRAKQMRVNKDAEHAKATNVFAGKDSAPRVVAVIPLCADVSAATAVRSLNTSLDIEEEVPEVGWTRTNVDRFKQKVQYVVVKRDLLAALDACRVADFVIFVLSGEEEVDTEGELILKSIESQGLTTCFTVVQGLDKIEPAKRRPQVVASLKSYISHFLPTTERVSSLDNRQEASNLIRSLCTTTTKGVRWRDQRSYMFIEDITWPSGKSAVNEDGTGEVVLTGVVRGLGLKADRLIQVGDWGDFQVDKIVAAPLEARKKGKDDGMVVDSEEDNVLDRPSEDQDDLADLAPEETIMEDATNYAPSMAATERKGVLLDDHHYFSDEEELDARPKPKRLPKGTSKYQSAWYLEDCSDSGSDLEDFDMEDVPEEGQSEKAHPADGVEGMDVDGRAMTEGGPSEYPQSEMFLDPSPEDEAEQIEAYRKSRKNEADEDLEFPDEIELHPNVNARERLIKYRGLKSLKQSVWETEEDKPYEPEEWQRLLEISDYKRTATKFLREAWAGGVKPGTRVHLHLRGVPLQLQQSQSRPLAMFSLLRHEHKRTSCNYSILLSSEHNGPLKSKTELIAQCGPRRIIINPLFSAAGNTPNNVHKFDRYLHAGQSAIASFMGPLTWGHVPVLYFQRITPTASPSFLQLIGTGTSLPPSMNRIIAKRIVLTGHPYKINKRVVTVRYMFFNDGDVKWFKSLPMWTKRGRSGFIKESLGTHGYFKATFDGKINPMDGVAVSLYKRVWPRAARAWRPEIEGEKEAETGVEAEVEMAI
ncbi:pre-rRNA processing protein-like protein Tsr1 [Dothidotthia symphoricarpi CBS 119687]|uniref:Pre-rRNA processing protein-like protein Tsr1 n=1 Tax=Dothidotthia symphoricarpi CBS 119687 TaxID=1392245 RepID=A0A6A6AI23_9PLEO|nr:pre-rRNA processing protein-like protein Tsr1 [Dothidotthia symphoricarpi CBS 119687]KAF2131206.1 pre-rRNA processing protein-like protein Tsr1 [Dothidotthia symphoricarpi CBS 119687]